MHAVYAYEFLAANGTPGLKIGISSRPSNSYQQFKHKYGICRVGGIAVLAEFENRQDAYREERQWIRALRKTGHRHFRLSGKDSRLESLGELYSRETFYWKRNS